MPDMPKRQREGSPSGVGTDVSAAEELSLGFEKVHTDINQHEVTNERQIARLKAQVDRLEEAYNTQTAATKRDLAAKNAQVRDYERQLGKLQESAALYHITINSAKTRAEQWCAKHAEVLKSNEKLLKDAIEAQKKQGVAEERLKPYATRLEELKTMGQRVHDNVIRRVIRLSQLENERQAMTNSQEPVNPKERKEVFQEIADQQYVLAKAWEQMEAEYMEVTNNGFLEDQEDEE